MNSSAPQSNSEDTSPREPLPVWKKLAFMVALLLGLSGLALTRNGGGDVQPATSGGDVGIASFNADLSFAVAFAIGVALRTFMKLTMVVLGVVALAIFGLQKAGIVGQIDWTVAQGHWDTLTTNIGQQFESFKTFVTGSLPSAGAGTVGLVSGFRK